MHLENCVSVNYTAHTIDEFSYLMIWFLIASKLLAFFSLSTYITYREKSISRLFTSVLIGIYWRFTTLSLKVPFGYFINMTDLSFTERKHYLTSFFFFKSLVSSISFSKGKLKQNEIDECRNKEVRQTALLLTFDFGLIEIYWDILKRQVGSNDLFPYTIA